MNLNSHEEEINVVLTSSEYYVPYTYVLMQSILENTNRKIHFYILTYDISSISKENFEILKNIKDFKIDYVYIDIKQYPIPKQMRANPIVYAKMNLPQFLPELKKCIVLDSDIIVLTDIGKIYDIDLGDNYVAWVKDPIDVEINPRWIVNFGLPKEKSYINSGVLILNLDAYKKDNIEEKLLKNYAKFQKDILFFDQDLLYITLSEKCIYLDYKYNYLCALPYDEPGLKDAIRSRAEIIHYGTDKKPWVLPNLELAYIWWQYARRTPYYEIILERMFAGIKNKSALSKEDFACVTSYRKNVLAYWRYKLLSKITFGKTKKHYKEKRILWKEKIKRAEKITGRV